MTVARPSKLTVDQQAEVTARLAAGEGVRALAREFGVGAATICRLGVSERPKRVRAVAEQLAAAQSALAELPARQQHQAVALADQLRAVSANLAIIALNASKSGALLSEAHLAQARKVDPDAPMENSQDELQAISALGRMVNEAMAPGLNLINASARASAKESTGAVRGLAALTDEELAEHARSIGI